MSMYGYCGTYLDEFVKESLIPSIAFRRLLLCEGCSQGFHQVEYQGRDRIHGLDGFIPTEQGTPFALYRS